MTHIRLGNRPRPARPGSTDRRSGAYCTGTDRGAGRSCDRCRPEANERATLWFRPWRPACRHPSAIQRTRSVLAHAGWRPLGQEFSGSKTAGPCRPQRWWPVLAAISGDPTIELSVEAGGGGEIPVGAGTVATVYGGAGRSAGPRQGQRAGCTGRRRLRCARASRRAARFDQNSTRRRASSTTSYTLLSGTAVAWLSMSASDTSVRSKKLAASAPSSREVKATFGCQCSVRALAGHRTVRPGVGEKASAAAGWQDEHACCTRFRRDIDGSGDLAQRRVRMLRERKQ